MKSGKHIGLLVLSLTLFGLSYLVSVRMLQTQALHCQTISSGSSAKPLRHTRHTYTEHLKFV